MKPIARVLRASWESLVGAWRPLDLPRVTGHLTLNELAELARSALERCPESTVAGANLRAWLDVYEGARAEMASQPPAADLGATKAGIGPGSER